MASSEHGNKIHKYNDSSSAEIILRQSCPVYAVELPFMIVDFMKKAEIQTDYFFFILTCGYGYEVSLGHAEVAARYPYASGSGN